MERVEHIVQILEVFYKATHVVSKTDYPITNLFLGFIWKVKEAMDDKQNHSEEFVHYMVSKMKVKFDKY